MYFSIYEDYLNEMAAIERAAKNNSKWFSEWLCEQEKKEKEKVPAVKRGISVQTVFQVAC